MRLGSERPETRAALVRDGNRCRACSFGLKCALSVHHRLPKELGGRDTPSNLITLCVNCHKIVHRLSVGERLEGPEAKEARDSYGSAAFAKLRELAEAVAEGILSLPDTRNSEWSKPSRWPPLRATPRILQRN